MYDSKNLSFRFYHLYQPFIDYYFYLFGVKYIIYTFSMFYMFPEWKRIPLLLVLMQYKTERTSTTKLREPALQI